MRNDVSLALIYKILEDLVFMGMVEVEIINTRDDPYTDIKKYFIRNKIIN